jgi:hypothetical protein
VCLHRVAEPPIIDPSTSDTQFKLTDGPRIIWVKVTGEATRLLPGTFSENRATFEAIAERSYDRSSDVIEISTFEVHRWLTS